MKRFFILLFALFLLTGCVDTDLPEDLNIIYECGHDGYAFHDEGIDYNIWSDCPICSAGTPWQDGYDEAVENIIFLLELNYPDAVEVIKKELPDFYGHNSPVN